MSRGRSGMEILSQRWWRPRYRVPALVAVCFLLELCATVVVGLGPNVIWVANGLLLAYLLLAPRWRWQPYLAAGFAGQFLGGILGGQQPWPIVLVLAALNVSETTLAAVILRPRSDRLPNFTDRAFLTRFIAFAVLSVPAVMGAVFAVTAYFWVGQGIWQGFRDWIITDSLGMAVATPAFVAILRMRFRETLRSRSALFYPLLLIVAAPAALAQNWISPTVILFPLVILIQLRLGLGWASMSTLYVAGAGGLIANVSGSAVARANMLGASLNGLRLHLIIASIMVTVYAVSVVMESLRATERKLKETAFLHQLVTENSRDVIIIADFQGSRNYVSAAHASLGGWTRDELLNLHSLDLVHPDDRANAAALMRELRTGRGEAMLECRVRKQDGSYIWVEASLRTIHDPLSSIPTGILNIVRDISGRKRAEQSRDFHQSLLGAIHDVSLDAILVVNDEGKAVSYNRRFAEVWQITAPDLPTSLLNPIIEISDEHLLSQCLDKVKDPQAFLERVQELYSDREANDQCQVELKDGRTLERYSTALHSDNGRYLGRVWFFRDVTERIRAEQELKKAYDAVEKLAVVDALTGLANRRRFDAYLAAEWRRGMREHRPLSMILVDVDLFKLYNDTYGHVKGDMCLKKLAESAMGVVTRAGDLVARFGGEEFAIVLPNTDVHGALLIARQLSDAVSRNAICHEGSPYHVVTISAGCASVVPQPGMSSSHLVELADHAMYEAKRHGRNRVFTSQEDGSTIEGRTLDEARSRDISIGI